MVCERGTEYDRRCTVEFDELLYWTFESVTDSMASGWEVAHRIETEDFRIQQLRKQLDLMEALSPAWRARLAFENRSRLQGAGLDPDVEGLPGGARLPD